MSTTQLRQQQQHSTHRNPTKHLPQFGDSDVIFPQSLICFVQLRTSYTTFILMALSLYTYDSRRGLYPRHWGSNVIRHTAILKMGSGKNKFKMPSLEIQIPNHMSKKIRTFSNSQELKKLGLSFFRWLWSLPYPWRGVELSARSWIPIW